MASVSNHFRARRFGLSETATDSDGYTSHKSLIENYLRDLSFSKDPRLTELVAAMRHSLLVGDERIRPVLCMEVAGTFGLDAAEVLPSAAAIELLHTGSLVHSSLPVMGDVRRGSAPSCCEEFSDATVILAGDALFSEALTLIVCYQKGKPEQLIEAIRELATSASARGMIGGQAITIELGKHVADPEMLNAAYHYRTGALLMASARIGAILGGATAEEKETISEYARQLGLCVQVSSDILRASSTSKSPDQSAGGEADHQKVSFVRAYGLPGARRLADEALREALETLDRLDRDTRGLAEMIHFAYSRNNHESVI